MNVITLSYLKKWSQRLSALLLWRWPKTTNAGRWSLLTSQICLQGQFLMSEPQNLPNHTWWSMYWWCLASRLLVLSLCWWQMLWGRRGFFCCTICVETNYMYVLKHFYHTSKMYCFYTDMYTDLDNGRTQCLLGPYRTQCLLGPYWFLIFTFGMIMFMNNLNLNLINPLKISRNLKNIHLLLICIEKTKCSPLRQAILQHKTLHLIL